MTEKTQTDALHEVVEVVRGAELTRRGLEHVLGVVLGYMKDVDTQEKIDALNSFIRGIGNPDGVEIFMVQMKAIDLQFYGQHKDN